MYLNCAHPTVYTRPPRLKWQQVDPTWRKQTGQRCRRSITAPATPRTVQCRNDPRGIGSSSRTWIGRSSHLSIRAYARFPIEVEASRKATTRPFINPRGFAASSKGGSFRKPCSKSDLMGPLVLAQTYSSTEEALCRRRLAYSGQGVVSHDHYSENGTRSATAAG